MVCKTGELVTEVDGNTGVVTEAIFGALLVALDTSSRPPDSGVFDSTGSLLELAAWLGVATLSVGLKTGELATEVVVTEVVLLPEVDASSRPPDEVLVLTGSSLGLAAWLWVATLSVGLKTGGLATEAVDSTEVVTEVVLLPEVDASSKPPDEVLVLTGSSLGIAEW